MYNFGFYLRKDEVRKKERKKKNPHFTVYTTPPLNRDPSACMSASNEPVFSLLNCLLYPRFQTISFFFQNSNTGCDCGIKTASLHI